MIDTEHDWATYTQPRGSWCSCSSQPGRKPCPTMRNDWTSLAELVTAIIASSNLKLGWKLGIEQRSQLHVDCSANISQHRMCSTHQRCRVCAKTSSHGCLEASFENSQATKELQRWWSCERYHKSNWKFGKRHRHDQQPHQVTSCFWNWCVRSCRDRTAGILSCCACAQTFGWKVL